MIIYKYELAEELEEANTSSTIPTFSVVLKLHGNQGVMAAGTEGQFGSEELLSKQSRFNGLYVYINGKRYRCACSEITDNGLKVYLHRSEDVWSKVSRTVLTRTDRWNLRQY